MPDELGDRFRSLDDLEPPDVYEEARRRPPRIGSEPRRTDPRRIGVIVLAAIVALAGIGFLFRAIGGPAPTPMSSIASSASAAPPIRPEPLIAFAFQPEDHPGLAIGVMTPGSDAFRQLTGLPADRSADPWIARYTFASDGSPTFSPDGTSIAFVRRYTEGINSLCMIDVDGSNFRVVLRDAQAAELSWSPDGMTIAFYSEQDGGIHLIDADGTHERPLAERTRGPNQDSPSWSPDGSRVYYASGDIWVADVEGGAPSRVADVPRNVSWVALCPEGSPIAFAESEPDGHTSAIWLVDQGGSDVTRVTAPGSGNWTSVSWTPAGNRLLVQDADGTAAFIDPDGGGFQPLTLPEGLRLAGPVAWWSPVLP
jgi:WD40 repeat protein